VDPIGGSFFLALTRDYTPQFGWLARRIALNSFILMMASFTIGSHVLTFFGISIPVVQVGGGLIVIATGWAMLKQKDETGRSAMGRAVSSANVLNEAFYPLTLPLTVGPGSISVAITLGANEPRQLGSNVVRLSRRRPVVLSCGNDISAMASDRLAVRQPDQNERNSEALVVPAGFCIGVQTLRV
jgi:multiple antibiotic resistance protein